MGYHGPKGNGIGLSPTGSAPQVPSAENCVAKTTRFWQVRLHDTPMQLGETCAKPPDSVRSGRRPQQTGGTNRRPLESHLTTI